MTFVYLAHPDLGAIRVPDEPGVVEWHESRGYVRAVEPDPVPFVPPKDASPAVDGFVQLVHPLLAGVVHDWPDNPEALQGARAAGWAFPARAEQPDEKPSEEPDEKPAKKTAAKKAAASATDQDKE